MPDQIHNNQLHRPQDIIDTALDILTEHFGRSLKDVAERLSGAYQFKASSPDLSKVREVSLREGVYCRGESTRFQGRKEVLSAKLIQLLKEEHGVVFSEEEKCFKGESKGKDISWGKLMPEPGVTAVRAGEYSARIHDKMDYNRLYERIRVSQSVRILQTYITDPGLFEDSCRQAIKNGCKFEILLLEPYSEAIRLRAKGLADIRREDVEGLAVASYKCLRHLAEKYPENFKFQTFNNIPSFTFFQIDRSIYVGFHWFQKLAKNGAYLEMECNPRNPMFRDIDEHFQELWASSIKKAYNVRYDCHLFRNGEKTVRRLLIDPNNYEALFKGTYHKIDFHGSVIDMLDGNSFIFLQTKLKDAVAASLEEEKRIGCFLLNINRARFSTGVIAVGKFVVEFEPREIRVNTVVLENLDPPIPNDGTGISREEKDALIEAYLRLPDRDFGIPSEVEFDDQMSTWTDLRRRVGAFKKPPV